MTETESPKDKAPLKRPGGAMARWLLGTAAVAALMAGGAYLARIPLAEFAAESWLRSQGIPAEVHIDRLTGTRLGGQAIFGPEDAPDLSIGQFDVRYDFTLFPRSGLSPVTVSTIHLKNPVIRADFTGGKLNLGTLTQLVVDQMKPRRVSGPPPQSVIIEDADVRVNTDFGLFHATGRIRLVDGALTALSVDMRPTTLTADSLKGQFLGGKIRAATVAEATDTPQLHIVGRLEGSDLSGGSDTTYDWRSGQTVVAVDGRLPYQARSAGLKAWTGLMSAVVTVSTQSVSATAFEAETVETTLTFKGALDTQDEALTYKGRTDIKATAARLDSGNTLTRNTVVSGEGLALTATLRPGGDAVLSGPIEMRTAELRQGEMRFDAVKVALNDFSLTSEDSRSRALFAGRADIGRAGVMKDLTLTGLTLSLDGDWQGRPEGWRLDLKSDATGRGQYAGLQKAAASRTAEPAPTPAHPDPVPPGDAIIALDAALRPFRLEARQLTLTVEGRADSPARFVLRAARPMQVHLNGGGVATITPRGPIIASQPSGAFDVALAGEGLPQLDLSVTRARVDEAGLIGGDYALNTTFDIVPLTGAQVALSGRFYTTADKAFIITLPQPATLTAQAADIGDHLTEVKANLSSRGNTPLFISRPGGWRAAVDVSDLSLVAAASDARIDAGAARVDAYSLSGSDALGMEVVVTNARAIDTAPEPQRFNPLILTGTLTQDAASMRGRFVAATPNFAPGGVNHPVAEITLVNDPATGTGRLDFTTSGADFTPGGLQADHISPLLALVMTRDAIGAADFTGGFRWTKQESSSGGVLKLSGLDFSSSAGKIVGVKGEITFTSLAPLLSEPGQIVTVSALNPGLPLTDLEVSLQFKEDRVSIARGGVMTPGGPVTLAPMDFLFDADAPLEGVLSFEALDLGDIIKSTDLSKSLSFTGRVTGRIPFSYAGQQLTVTDGYLKADAPGRLSLLRQAITDINAGGSLTASDPAVQQAAAPVANPMQDLAFQAIEHLAYESLDARIYSSPDGRLTFNFHIKGKSDPPVYQPSPRIPILDFITGKWAERQIDLPSNTPVELFLEVPVNVNEILKDLSAFQPR